MWSAGRINTIFTHTRHHASGAKYLQTFLLIDEYTPLSPSDATRDHFREFSVLGGCLFYNKFAPEPVLLGIDEVICHFGHIKQKIEGVEEDCIRALPLDKDVKEGMSMQQEARETVSWQGGVRVWAMHQRDFRAGVRATLTVSLWDCDVAVLGVII
ncbi:hypothetical protein BD779DRAFT_1478910 [Infundibulicybe gibba]|nr:hypothetical protein BD779DRAFT_1478910 [Infundibulicybe gibba]